MPFGLSCAPATFQSTMNTILAPVLRRFVLVFVDDILVYSKTLEEYCDHLSQVFTLLAQHQFYHFMSSATNVRLPNNHWSTWVMLLAAVESRQILPRLRLFNN